MQESVGMITAMNEVTQDARKTGTALKTISANMAGVNVSAKDGTIQANKTAKALKEIAGIDVWNKQTGEIKDMYTVMDELNGKWGDLSEAQRSALGVTIAGKTQLNTFNALMSNWDTARQYVKEYKEGLMVGSAERENAQYLDSIAGKWNVIKENMKAAGNTLITSDMTKGLLDIGIVLSEGFNKGVEGLTKGVSSVLKGSIFTDISTSISDNLYRAFEKINLGKGLQGAIEFIFGDFDFFDGIGEKLATSLSSAIGKAFEISFSQTSMGKALKPIMDMLNIDGLFEGKKLDNQIDGRNENINAIQSEIQSLKNQKQAIEDILPTYDELSKKTNRSVEENRQLTDMRNQLADSNPDLVLGYDKNGTPILKNLQAQNKQYESQIKLKQQSQRLEENSLANDVLQRRVNDQKEFNKAYKEYNDMQLASNTKKKEGLFGFGSESTQDYAKRIIEDNKKITEANQKTYDQRLKDHQQYMEDEKAIQQKYMNEMTQKASFNRLSEEAKSGMLTFMDALDWSQFSPAEGSQFAGMLANLGDKLVPTTEAMGKQSKAIAQLSQDYAEGKINLIDYTKGLTERYEAEKKFDAESFSTWKQDAQSYVDLTGDMIGASKAADVMAKSLSKITGIKASTWKTGLMFDPAPIDASNKALQKFLNSYGTGIQNMGKAKTDGLISQFETLQNSYTQMLDDISTQGTEAIDVEYLVNAKVNQPEPISELIDKIVSDNKVTESEIELLLNAQAEILNTGEISDETIKQIADEFDMTEAEVKAMLKIDAEVTGMEDLASKIEGWDELTNEEKELILTMTSEGEGEFKMSVEEWNQLTPEEKEEKLKLMAEGKEEIAEAKNSLEELPDEKNTNVNINASDTSGIDKGKEVEELPDNKRILVDASAGDTTGIEKGKEVEELPNDKNVIVNTPTGDITGLEKAKETETLPDNKNIMVNTPMGDVTGLTKGKEVETLPSDKSIVVNTPTGDTSGIEKGKEVETLPDNKQITVNASTGDTSGIEKAKEVEKLPKEKEIKVSIVQKAGNVLDSITNYFKSKAEQKVSLSVKVEGKDQVESLKNSISSLKGAGGNVTITATVNGKDQVESLKTSLSSMKNANVSVTITGNALSQANQIKSALMGIQAKNISINASGNALGQINSIKSALSGLQSKSISINASVGGTGAINALKAAIAGLKSRAVNVTASASGTGAVNSLTSAINRVKSKSVKVAANVSGTGAVNSLVSAINRVKSKSVKISASVSGTGAVQGLASAIAGVRSKSVSVSVTKTVTTVERSAVASSTPISATPMLTNTPLADIPVSLSATDDIPTVTASDIAPVNVPVSISARNSSLIDTSKLLSSLDYDINAFKNLEEALKRIANQLDLIDEKAKNSFGQEKIDLLRQQISLLKQQQQVQKQIEDSRKIEAKQLKKSLSSKGFTFDDNGSIKNYQDKLIAMEKNVESLKKKYDNLNDAKKKNETAIKNAQKAYDNANEELSKTKKYLNEYFEANNEADEASEKWYEYQNAIKEAEQAIRDAQNDPLRNRLDSLGGTLDYLEAKYKSLGNQDKIKNLKDQENIYKKQQTTIGLLVEQLEKQLATMDKQSDEYKDTKEEIDELNKQWWNIEESINDVTNETKELNRQMKLLSAEAKFEELDELFTELQFKLDLINEKMEYAWGTDKIDAMRDSIGLLNGQLDLQQQKINSINARLAIYQDSLKKYNFQFDARGNSTNYSEVLDSYKNSTQLEEIIDLYEEYKDAHEELQDQMIEYWKIENEIKDLQKEKLEITQDVEEEITKIIEKEYEKRKDEIEKYTDERIKLLEKEKQIYKDMRDEQEYQKSINEQTSEIEKINSLIATASRDTSIAGQKRLKELMEDLAEAQKELEEMTQDKIDEDYSNNIDDEIDRLEEEQDKLIASLDEKFSETNIAKMVAQAMSSGFIEINGEVKSLQDALIQSVNDSTEGYSVMADVVKNELVSNLNVALSTMQQIADINEKLGLQSFNVISATQAGITNVPTYASGNSRTVTIGDTIINVSGSVDDITLSKIEDMIKEENERMLKEITNGI